MGALVMFSCTKNEVVYSDASEIALRPVAKVAVKGAAVTTVDNLTEDIRVFSYRTEANAGASWADEQANVKSWFNVAGTSYVQDTPYWHGNPRQYWPKSGSLFFAGVHPHSTNGVTFDPATGSLTVADFEPGVYHVDPAASKHVDLMWFDIDENTSLDSSAEKVNVLFHHALSYVTINISCEAAGMFEVTGLKLVGLDSKNTFDSISETWGTASATGDYDLTEGLTDGTVTKKANPLTFDNILLLPQDITSKKLHIEFKQKAGADAPIEDSPLQQDDLDLDFTAAAGNFTMGKHYTYNIVFTPGKEILINPSVKDWENVTEYTYPDQLPRI